MLPGLDTLPLMGGWNGSPPALELNVWTPDPSAAGLPVLVWLHGGAFVGGSPSQPIYDGTAFARDGVVVVSPVYRLGAEGLLPFEGGDTNVALRDQLAALAWVQREIAAFGGDPARVTVAGQSAGAMCLGWLLGTPRSEGLLQRAIVMSGGMELTLSMEQGRKAAAFLAERAGAAPTAAAMRAVPIADLVAAQGAVGPGEIDLTTDEHPDPTGGMLWLLPVRDGDLVADDPLAAIRNDVDLLAGTTTEEGRLYVAGVPGFDDAREQMEAAAAQLTEMAFTGPTRRLLDHHAAGSGATYAYSFGWRSGAIGGRLGAAHAVDLPFAFDTLAAEGMAGTDAALLGIDGGPQALADRMHSALVAFVRDGDPGWAPYEHVETLEAATHS